MEKRPRTTDSFLKTHGKGVVALMPTPYSEISSFIYNGDGQSALKKYEFYKSVFDDVLIEIPLLEDEDYREINANVIGFCQKNGIKMVPVINSHYDTIDDEDAFPIFQRCGALRGGMSYEVDHAPHMYMKTREEVLDTFHRFHESNVFTQEVMDGLLKSLDDLCESFTALELDTSPKTPHFENSDIELREHAWEGFHKCGFDDKPNAQVYKDRLEYELKNIIGAGFADYFLLIKQMFDWHVNVNHRISSVGRGSAAGSLVLRCLGVTKIDPVKHNLLFERFLDASRLNEIVEKGGKVIAASIWGKLKTVTQMIAIIFCFLDKFSFGQFIFRVSDEASAVANSASIYMTTGQFVINIISAVMLVISVVATIFSGVDYLKNGKDLLKD